MNTRSKIATKFYTSKRAECSVQIGLAGREVDFENVSAQVNATHRLSSLAVSQAPALRAPCATHISKANARKSYIFKAAWALAALKAKRFGGQKCVYFAACLKVAYRQFNCTTQELQSRYKDFANLNHDYLVKQQEQLQQVQTQTGMLHREENIKQLEKAIRQAKIRQSYYVDLILGSRKEEIDAIFNQ